MMNQVAARTEAAGVEGAGWTARVALVLLAWGVTVAALALAGVYRAMPPRLFPLLAASGIALPTLLYLRVPGLRRWFDALGQRRVILFHSWRMVAALVFWSYGARGLLPAAFVRNAAWGDFLVGLVALLALRFPPSRRAATVFHLAGLADLLCALGTGALFAARADPVMGNIAGFPLALIPLYGVGITAATHLASLVQLLRERRAAMPALR